MAISKNSAKNIITQKKVKPFKIVKNSGNAPNNEGTSALKKIENNLLTTSEGLEKIFDSIDDGITLVSLDGIVLDCNQASLALLGLTRREELIGKNVYDRITPEDKQQAINDASQVLKTGKIVSQVRFLKKSGVPFWAEISVTVLYDNNRQPALFLGVTRDITERKRILQELKESEEIYRTLFDSSDDGFILVEPIFDENNYTFDYRFLKVNPAYERLTGAKSGEVLGKRVKEVAPDLDKSLFSLVDFVIKNQKAKHNEFFDQHSDKWYDSYYFPFGKNRVGILFRDISKQKSVEAALRSSEERYRLYVESSPVAFFVIDSEQKYIQVNDAASRLLGYTKEELLKMTIFDVTFKEDIPLAEDQYKELMQNGKSIREFRLKKKDGQPVYIILNTILLSDGKAMAFCENITERKNLEKHLHDNERLATIGQTASMVGHDIRNPLQAIIGDLFLIENTIKAHPTCPSKDFVESLEGINENIFYINKIVSDLQDYTRTIKATLAEVDVRSLIFTALEGRKIPEGIQLQVDVKNGLRLITDVTYFKRIISNLVGNAIQAMPNGGKVTITAAQNKDSVAITVADTGVGIKDEDKVNLFKPLFTTKAKGQGLGLAVVKRFVDALNGSIALDTEVGRGTKFTISLPNNQPIEAQQKPRNHNPK
ncbi:MAG: PAS domain S-box protein [Candidatus Bathyarchaeota archaeon]|nr:PAS domain S-box protein [Candidatus Bathyarchaeota archaeon]